MTADVISIDTSRTESADRYENINLTSITLFGGSGGGEPPVDAETQRYLDKSMESVKAQNDARFAEVLTRLDQMPKFWPSVLALVLTVFGAVGSVFAVLAYASDRFDSGVSSMGAVGDELNAQRQINSEQNERLNRIIHALESQVEQPQGSPEERQN